MAYVITDKCIGNKHAECVAACPCDSIHPTSDEAEFESAPQLFIDPDACIDCGLCAMECPVGAIYPEDELEGADRRFVQLNASHFH